MIINPRLPIKSKLWISVASLIATILFLETSVRTYDLTRGYGFFSNHRNLVANTNTQQTRFPFRTYGFQLYKEVNNVRQISSRHGELYPIQKPPDTYRIVVFGGSSTENGHVYSQTKMHYPLLLQSHLRTALNNENVEVINVGMSGYAMPHSLILLELDVLTWDPDLVILSHNVNDLLAAYWPNFTYDYSHKYGTQYYFCSISIPNLMFQHSQLYWAAKFKLRSLQLSIGPEITRKPYGDELQKETIDVFKRNLHSFVALAKHNDIEVLLGTQPLQPDEGAFDAHMRHKKYNNIVVYPLHNEFIMHHNAFNNTIKDVANETNTYLIDNDKLLAGNKKFFIDYVHYTLTGLELLAQGYTDYILGNNIVNLK